MLNRVITISREFGSPEEKVEKPEKAVDKAQTKDPQKKEPKAKRRKTPDHFAVRQYAKFKLAVGKTLKSILAEISFENFQKSIDPYVTS